MSPNRKSFFLFILVAALLGLFVFPVSTPAQGAKGTLSGKVSDSSGAALYGARIALDPGGASTVSDVQGQFLINGLDAGNYTVTITYVGFKTFTKSVAITGSQTVSVEAQLSLESVDVEVVVTSERGSAEVEAVNRERNADNIVQVLPADVIRSLPNANMADALGRLPSVTIERDEGEGKYVQIRGTEPRLANTTIDGVNIPSPESGVRQIKFDAIPADIVESVEINKTLQANMDGDGIGGSVNLVTKTAGERPTISVSGMGGYTPIQGGRNLVETAGTLGQRFGAQKKFGLLVGGTYDWNGRGIDDIEPVPDIATFPDGTSARYFTAIDIREYQYYRSRWGIAGGGDYKLGEGSNIYFHGLYSDFHNYGDRWVYSLTDNTPGITLLGSNGGTPSFNVQIRRPDYAIASILLGGKHVLSTTWYAWDISASRASQEGQVGDRTALFSSNLPASNCQYDLANTTNIYNPQWTNACFTEAYTNQTTLPLTRMQVNHGLTAQLNLQFAGAMAKRYHIGSHLSSIEFGGKFRNAHKFANTSQDTFTPTGTGANLTLADFPNSFTNTDYYQGAYKLGPNPKFSDVYNAFSADLAANSGNYSLSTDISSQFDLIEKVSAGYVMNTIDFNKIRFVAGVRFEGTNLDTSAPTFDASGNFVGIAKSSGSYVKVLPSASIRYALRSDTNLRFVYGRGFSRPNPQDIAQPLSFDNTANPVLVSLGNPNLKPETADNIDVLIEHYFNPFGLITAGYFYKNFIDPIVTEQSIVTSGSFASATCTPTVTCRVTQPNNAGSAWLSGFEIAYLQHLTFLPGVLKGLGISANYGYTASSTSGLPGRSDHPRLLRNAPHTWNISPTYDRGRVSIRVGLSYNAANIAAYQFTDGTPFADGTPSTVTAGGLKGPFGDNYFYAHLQVDAQGSVRLAHGLSFVMYGLNLTDEVFGFYNGSPQYMLQREYYRPTVAAGMRWNPTFEHK
jgi:TonB-dependent receptor